VAWFTSRLSVPGCLMASTLVTEKDGETNHIPLSDAEAHALALNRVALGFRAEEYPVVRWPDHRGYRTSEGRDLNETAREAGDDPDEWWISETPLDVLTACEVYIASNMMRPKLVRNDEYLRNVKQMVAFCRDNPGTFIPPSWMQETEAKKLAKMAGVSIAPLP
jgi:hypothetical protein